jgi:hypothetical protein
VLATLSFRPSAQRVFILTDDHRFDGARALERRNEADPPTQQTRRQLSAALAQAEPTLP